MKVEYTEGERRPTRKKRKKHSKIKRIIIAVLSILFVLAAVIVLMITVFFNVSSVKVIGSSIYSTEDIIYASGIMNGDNLLRMPSAEIKARIVKALPYIKEAEIIKSFPDAVGIRVEPATEKYLILNDGVNYVADSDFKILRSVTEFNSETVRVKGITAEGFYEGQELQFSDKQQKDVFNDIMSICTEKGLNVTFVNIEKLVDINFAIDDRILVKLGTYSDLSEKLTHLQYMLQSVDTKASASISLKEYSTDNKESVLKYEEIAEFIK